MQLLGLLLFALSPWYPLSFLMLLASGLGSSGYSTMQSTIMLMSAAPQMRGAALGGLAMGAVADLLNAQVAIGVSASVGLALLLPIVILSPLVWRPVTSEPATPAQASGAESAVPTQPKPL